MWWCVRGMVVVVVLLLVVTVMVMVVVMVTIVVWLWLHGKGEWCGVVWWCWRQWSTAGSSDKSE